MKVRQAIMVDENGHIESYDGYAIGASGEEIRIITKALKVFLDYSPRSAKEMVGYESKKLAVEMVESIRNAEEVKVRHEPNDEQTDCQTCKWWSSYGYCVHRECKGYEPQTDWHYDEQDATWYPYKHEDEPQTERSE